MKPLTIAVIVAILAGALVVGYVLGDGDILAGLTGVIDQTDQPLIEGTTPIDYTKFDLWTLLCHLSGKTLDQQITYDYIDRLNMVPSGSMRDYSAIYEDFSLHYTNKGYVYEAHHFETYPDGNGALLFLTKGAQGAMLFTATTGAVRSMTGYNTISVTMTGPLHSFYSFWNFVDDS
jgi:hypothetical protein